MNAKAVFTWLMILMIFVETVPGHAAYSCRFTLDFFPQGFLRDARNSSLVLKDPVRYLNFEFNFQDAVVLIQEIFGEKKRDRRLEEFNELLAEGLNTGEINIVNSLSLRRSGIVRSRLLWNSNKPKTTEELVNRLLLAINHLYQAAVPRIHLKDAWRTTPWKLLSDTKSTAVAMFKLQSELLSALGEKKIPLKENLISIIPQALNFPVSFLIDRQREQFRYLNLTPSIRQALKRGDLKEISQIVRLRFGLQTYMRWVSTTVSDFITVMALSTAIAVGPSFIHSFGQIDSVDHSLFVTQETSAIERAENYASHPPWMLKENLQQSLDVLRRDRNLSAPERQYAEELSYLLDQK